MNTKIKNKIKNAINSLAVNNKGASLVTVLITMFFLTSIGVTILNMSYTGVLIRQTQARGAQTYYAAEDIMDLIKVAFHEIASDSTSAAYEASLISYNSGGFEAAVAENVLAWEIPEVPSSTPAIPLASQTGTNQYSYNTAIFKNFLVRAGIDETDIYIVGDTSGDDNAPIHIDGGIINSNPGAGFANSGVITYNNEKIAFEGITITYTNAGTGLKTQITSDIVVQIPEYFSNNAAGVFLDFSSVNEYAIVAAEQLIVNGNIQNANVYANSIVLNATNASLNGTYITPTDFIIADSQDITLAPNSTLWANSLILNNSSSLTSQSDSDIYLADDLELNGNGSSATINGNLYGFGNSTENAQQSSTIVVNGLNSTLNLASTQRLMLAGSSFILPLSAEQDNGILMGESISVRPNQMAYLAPLEILTTDPQIETNPHVIATGGTLPALEISTTTPILNVNGEDKTLSSYGAQVVSMTYPLPFAPLSSAVYYFLEFDDVQGANEYFQDYFTVNGDELSEYLDLYTNFGTIGGSIQTSGNIIEQQADGSYTLPTINAVNKQSAEYMQNAFNNVCKTLENTGSLAQNPYEFIVDKVALRDFINNNNLQTTQVMEFKNASGETVAILINSDASVSEFTLNNTYSDVDLVIATGNITLSADFDGLVLCDGALTVATTATSINANAEDVKNAYSATYNLNGEEIMFSSFFTEQGNFAVSGEENIANELSISDYVIYENWNKQ